MSITSANAVFMLAVTGVFPVPLQLQGFSTDDMFSGEQLEVAQTQMGVDGVLSGGFVYVEYKQDITLQADSVSNAVFDAWQAANLIAQDVFPATGVITLSGVGTSWAMTKGFLTRYTPLPDAGKVLKARKHQITWQRAQPAPAL